MKDYTYEVFIIDKKGQEVSIFGPTKSLRGARNVALKQKKQVKIYRDNKCLPGGATGLDIQAYDKWLEDNKPD